LGESFGKQFQFFNADFSKIHGLLLQSLDGVFFDFGISSLQLDHPHRGFSFRYHTQLDMSMNPFGGISAGEFFEIANPRKL
jgi:16S rRNA (cytosine1402-N4)-methyltransferase